MNGAQSIGLSLPGRLALGQLAARRAGVARGAGRNVRRRSGVLNVGIEGTMLLGALASFLASSHIGMTRFASWRRSRRGSSKPVSRVDVRHRSCEPVVAGLVFNVLALGIASTVYRKALGNSAAPESIADVPADAYPLLSELPLIGPVLLARPYCFI